jgi:hypothetical protein
MAKPVPKSAVPTDHGWDIAFTRISRHALPHVNGCLQGLALRFEAIGLRCEMQLRHTPRGLSRFLAVTGQRGLLFIVDITLIDGIAVAGIRGAALDVRLLDACGDTVAHCAEKPASAAPSYQPHADEILAAAGLDRSAVSVFVMAMAHFDLVPAVERNLGA